MLRHLLRAPMRAMIAEATAGRPELLIPYTDDFLLERTLGPRTYHSADNRLYGAAVGAYLTDQQLPIRIRPERRDDFGWLEAYLDTPLRTAAMVAAAAAMPTGTGLAAQRGAAGYRDQFPKLHARAVATLERLDLRLASFAAQDPGEWLEHQDDRPVLTVPPIDLMYEDATAPALNAIIEWSGLREIGPAKRTTKERGYGGEWKRLSARIRAEVGACERCGSSDDLEVDHIIAIEDGGQNHRENLRVLCRACHNIKTHSLTGPAAVRFVELVQRRPAWWMVLQHPYPELEPFLMGRHEASASTPPLMLYGTGPTRRISRAQQRTEQTLWSRLGPDERPAAPLELRPISMAAYIALRSAYLNPRIPPSMPDLAFAVTAAGKLVGAFGIRRNTRPAPPQVQRPAAFLIADFPVEPAVPHLASLVLRAALSTEARRLIERRLGRIRSLLTTAYSDRPVSMKYRGAFDLLARHDAAEPVSAHKGKPATSSARTRYRLQYAATAGRWTLDQALEEWT